MSGWSRPRRAVILPCTAIALVALALLLIAGARHTAVRTASVDAPNQITVATLRPGHPVCEGPVTSDRPANAVSVWGAAAGPRPATMTVTVRDASTHASLATGVLRPIADEGEWPVQLNRDVPDERPVQVCLSQMAGEFSLAGSAVSADSVSASGVPGGARFSLVLLSDGRRSLLGSLPLAFSRASLWRLSWVRPWTFWVLAFALLMTFGLVVVAVVKAAGEDEQPPPPAPDDQPRGGLPSEARKDRPQPVS
jgi:hypothetical protein